jgi:exodeoxyribonuclease VII small subunit
MPKQLTFEAALAKLEETVRRLEEGNLPLDQAVSLFEEGTRLARLCNQQLEAAELRVSQLTRTTTGDLAEQDITGDAAQNGA